MRKARKEGDEPAAAPAAKGPAAAARAEKPIGSSSSRKLRVGLLFGGRSVEHEVSILSARSVCAALDPRRYEVVPIGIDKAGRWTLQERKLLAIEERDPGKLRLDARAQVVTLPPFPDGAPSSTPVAVPPAAVLRPLTGEGALAPLDVVFPVLHGTYGEDGTVQGLLELAGIAYVGSGVLGSAIGMDKDVQKRVLREAGLPVTRFRTVRAAEWRKGRDDVLASLGKRLTLPVFVKPANGGSSVGVRKVKDPAALEGAVEHALSFDEKAVVEEAIFGREIECAVLGDEDPRASVPGEVVVKHDFYSYEAKYVDPDGARLEVPAQLSAPETEEVRRLAVAAFRALECSGMARVDFFVAGNGQRIYVNEVNTIPGFTAISMYPKLWEASGTPYRELVERLIDLALRRRERRGKLRTSIFGPDAK